MTSIQRMMITIIFIVLVINGDRAFSQTLPEQHQPLTASQEIFLDTVAERTWNYLTNATSNHLPFSWVRVAPGLVGNGTYANPAEIGLYLLSYVGAYEMDQAWSPSITEVEGELLLTLTQLRSWQTGSQVEQPHGANAYNNSVFFQAYWVDNNPPIVGPGNYDKIVPSIDNAILAASLLTIREWADVNDAMNVFDKAQAILGDMDFIIWFDNATNRFQWGDTNNPLSGGPADYYSNENRLINFVARALGQMSTSEFQASLGALVQAPATYTPTIGDPITVDKVAWDGSYFTYTAPALFLREIFNDYGTNTIDPATQAQIAYAVDQNYTAWGLSDVYDLCEFDAPNVPVTTNTYRKQGAPPIPANNGNPLEERPGLVTPHTSALALLSPRYASVAVTNLQQLAQFNSLYSSTYGFKDSVMVKVGDAHYGEASCRYSLLAQAYIFLAIVEHKTGFIQKHYYLDSQVQMAHQEANLGYNLGSVPTLISPDDNLASENKTPTFIWESVPGVIQYALHLDTVNPPEHIVASSTGLSYKPTTPLLVATYYWQVRAIDAMGNPSSGNEIRSLEILSSAKDAPLLNYFTATPVLSWNRVTGATGYEIQVDGSPRFTEPLDFSTTIISDTAPLFITTSALASGKYYWRVRAKYSNDYGNWSVVDTFWVDTP